MLVSSAIADLFKDLVVPSLEYEVRISKNGTNLVVLENSFIDTPIKEQNGTIINPLGQFPIGTLSLVVRSQLAEEYYVNFDYEIEYDTIVIYEDINEIEHIEVVTSKRYIVKNATYDKGSNKTTFECSDYGSRLTDIYKEPTTITYPITFSDWTVNYFNELGYEVDVDELFNADFIVSSKPNLDESYTVLDVGKAIARFGLCMAYFDNTNTIKFKRITSIIKDDIVDTIAGGVKSYKTDTDMFKTLGVNTLVLGLQSDIPDENVSMKDETMIAIDGQVELRIDDTPFTPTQQDKQNIISSMFNAIKGFKYRSYELESKYWFYEIGDIIEQQVDNEIYRIPIYRIENEHKGSVMSKISATSESVEQTNNAWTNFNPRRKTEIKIDKINQQILLEVSERIEQGIELEKSVNGIAQRTSEIEVALEGIRLEVSQLGGYNIISNILGKYGYLDWTFEADPFLFKQSEPFALMGDNIQPIFFMDDEMRIAYPEETNSQSQWGWRYWHEGLHLSALAPAQNGTEYSLHMQTKGTGTLTFKLREYTGGIDSNKNSFSKETILGTSHATTNWSTFEHTLTLADNTNAICLVIQSNVDVYNQQYAIHTNGSFNVGMPKPYEESLTDVNNRVDHLTARVELSEDKVDVFTQRVETIDGRVNTQQAQLTVQSNQIALTVRKNNVISEINQTSETIKIQASKLELSGYATFSALSTAGQTTIHGANITTGTINATKLNVTNLSSITSNLGSITGGSLNINGRFIVDTSGNLTANNVNLSGTITSTSGSIGGWSVSSSAISSRNGVIQLDSANDRIVFGTNRLTRVTNSNFDLIRVEGSNANIVGFNVNHPSLSGHSEISVSGRNGQRVLTMETGGFYAGFSMLGIGNRGQGSGVYNDPYTHGSNVHVIGDVLDVTRIKIGAMEFSVSRRSSDGALILS